MKYEIRFLPGVREHDIPAAPRAYQEALVMRLREMAQGRDLGRPLEGHKGKEVLGSWCKAYINPPGREQRLQRNYEEGGSASERMQGGGYRMVYREMLVRETPTLLVAGFGPRKNNEVYETAAQRIVKAQEEQRMRQQATQSAALPRQAASKLPRSAPAPGAPPTSGAANRPRNTPRL